MFIIGVNMMEPVEFFEKYKKEIYSVAEFICSKDSSKNIEEEFENMKKQYYKKIGTGSKEIVILENGNIKYNISSILDEIRYSEVENTLVYIFFDGKYKRIQCEKGTRFNSSFNIELIEYMLIQFLKQKKNISLYFVHNHPFIYRASMSQADENAVVYIVSRINYLRNMFVESTIDVLDFAVVTYYDYYSMKQEV